MILKSENIEVLINDSTGFTESLINPNDEYKTNWIYEKANWGEAEGFSLVNVENEIDCSKAVYQRDNIKLFVKKSIVNDCYYEEYSLTNDGASEFFLTKDNFGIQFPYQCNYSYTENVLDDTCLSHIWCGSDICWIYSVKCNGNAPYLVMNVTEGAIDDYSINYNMDGIRTGSFYRGAFVLHPKSCRVMSGETVKYTFCYKFSDKKLDRDGTYGFTAEKYTLTPNEKVRFTLKTEKNCDNVKISCNGNEYEFEKSDNVVCGEISFDETGEKKIIAEYDGKSTFMYVNVLKPMSEILSKRAEFIVNKQQYHNEKSPLDGAYLIYDDQTESLYYNSAFSDHNSARERIGMGVFLCRQLKIKYDENIMNSLKKHREFIEREIFDENTGFVYNDVCKRAETRIFNFPWLASYYLEWYNLTGEKKCIENAVKIMFNFFELAEYKYNAQCIDAVGIYNGLVKEGLNELGKEFIEKFLKYVNLCVSTTDIKNECSYCNEIPCCYLSYQSQAYILSGDDKYLNMAKNSLKMLEAFFAYQPDFHLNCVPVRYWDRYWFGKHKEYGDVFPHYWSSLAAWAFAWYDKATGSNEHQDIINENLKGNLCLYREDGFAHNNYLYPYKITMFSTDPNYKNKYMKSGVTYGKNYDIWANDQDWAFYFAALFYR